MDAARTMPKRAEDEQFLFCSEVLSTRAYETYVEPVVPGFGLDVAPFMSGTREVLQKLFDSLFAEIVDPLLSAPTTEACALVVHTKLGDFVRTMNAIRVVVAKLTPEIAPNVREATAALVRGVTSIYGEAAKDEVAFITETYASAMRILRTLQTAPPEKHAQRDHELIAKFEQSVAFYQLASIAIIRAPRGSGGVSVDFVMELLRHGALSCYGVVREAVDLRSAEPETNQGWLPVDDEDFALAMAN